MLREELDETRNRVMEIARFIKAALLAKGVPPAVVRRKFLVLSSLIDSDNVESMALFFDELERLALECGDAEA